MSSFDAKDTPLPVNDEKVAADIAAARSVAASTGATIESVLKSSFQIPLANETGLQMSGLEDPNLVARIRAARANLAQQSDKKHSEDDAQAHAQVLQLMSKTMRLLSSVTAEVSAAAELVFIDAANAKTIAAAAATANPGELDPPYGYPPLEQTEACVQHLATKIENHATMVQKAFTALGELTAFAEQWRRACERLADSKKQAAACTAADVKTGKKK